ncbi:Hypothetical protein NTJ_10238 [Nesidiocoris tenuis]|uniref:Uncharacterized protein n=1 Tax=Nesidiocoris tenuis TaxID=355587 RepID=A0ABN7AZ32_9HEMI|nr:Hypothetical protein NTJ_10238 [Nesidiocoris tenuis]
MPGRFRANEMRRTLSTASISSVASSRSDDGSQDLELRLAELTELLEMAKLKQRLDEITAKKLKAEAEFTRFEEDLAKLQEAIKSKLTICRMISKVLEANSYVESTKRVLKKSVIKSDYLLQCLVVIKTSLSQLANCVVLIDVDFDEKEIRAVLEKFSAKDPCPDLTKEIKVADQVEEISAILERFKSDLDRYEQLVKDIENTIHQIRVMQVRIFVALEGSQCR